MSFRQGWSRTKARFKTQLGISRDELESTSSPNSREPSPGPRSTQCSVKPQPDNKNPTPHVDSISAHTLTPASANLALTSAKSPNPASLDAPTGNIPPVPGRESGQPNMDSHSIENKADSRRGKSIAWPGLKTLLKVVEVGTDAFGPLKLAISEFNRCIDIFEQASQGRKEYEELQVVLDSLLGDLGQFLSGKANQIMTRSMISLTIGIQHEVSLIKRKSGRNTIQRHMEAPGEADDIIECYRRIRGHLNRLALNANLGIWAAVNDLSEGLRDTRLQRLSPSLSALYDSAKSSVVHRRRCTPGTRVREIDRLLAWAHDPEGRNVFWMNGMAGTGKTTIAYSVCAELDKKAALGASFFCSRLISECRDVGLIIPAIAYQLAQFSYPFRCAVSKVLEVESDVYARVLEKQFDSLLFRPLLEVKHTLPEDFVVVIDALDECENKDSVAQILGLLLPPSPSSTLPLRFIVSSRPDPDIYAHMMAQVGDSLSARLVLHDLDDHVVKQDIDTYLRAELESVNLTPVQLQSLVERSGVLFIFAATAARYIKAGLRLKLHHKRLNMILGLAPVSRGGHNQDIDMLYSPILRTALESRDLDDGDRELMKALLDTVICLQEPMTVHSLASLLDLDGGEHVEALLRPLSSVLSISEANGLITTLHASFPDYMLDSTRSQSLHCHLATNNLRLAVACLRRIQSNPRQLNLRELNSSYTADENEAGRFAGAEQAISSDLSYACRHWISHTIPCSRQDLEQLVHDFLSSRLLMWIEVLNLNKCMNLGPGIIQRAETWSRGNHCKKETAELAHDAWRFVSMFAGHAVSKSTPHIYVSMLPLWPDDAPVSKCYGRGMHQAVKVQGTAMTRRWLTNLTTWTFDTMITVACFSPDDSLIAYGTGSSIYLIDGSTGSAVLGPLRHHRAVLSVAFSPDGALLASGSEDSTVRVWRTQSGESAVDPMIEHTDYVTSVCFTPDGAAIVSGSRDKTIRAWYWRDKRVLGPFEGHSDWVRSVCVSPDGTHIASGSDDATVRLWDIENGKMALAPMKGNTDYVRSVCFSSDGTRIITGSEDKAVRIWSAQTGQQLAEPFRGHTHYITSVALSLGGNQIASGSEDNTIRLWNMDGTSESTQLFGGHTGYVNSVAFSSDGTRILSCSNDKTIRIWDTRSKSVVDSPLEAHTRGVSSVCFSLDGTRLLSASSDATVRAWNACSGHALLGPLQGHLGLINCARYSPDGKHIAVGSVENTIQLWDSDTGEPAGEPLSGHRGGVYSVCFSPDGALIVSGSHDQTVRVWSTQTGKTIAGPLTGHTGSVLSVCFSPSGTCAASGSADATIRVWDVMTGKLTLGPLKEHDGRVWSVCFSPDGTRIASASRDKTIRLWDSSTGETVCAPLEGHTGEVNSVCFSPNGEFITSASDDTTIRLWDAHTGMAIGVLLTGHTRSIWSASFSPDGGRIVSGSDDATIRVFDVSDLATLRDNARSSSPPDKDQEVLVFACQPWMLRDDGWLVDAQSRLLAWVPLDLHTRLLRPRNTLLIAPMGSVKIELNYDRLGADWADCYKL